jgi:hypothetical protein
VLWKLRLTRTPAGRICLGTQCSQSRWHLPPITTRSPPAGVKAVLGPPERGLSRNRLLAPRLSTGTVHCSRLQVFSYPERPHARVIAPVTKGSVDVLPNGQGDTDDCQSAGPGDQRDGAEAW